MRLGFSSSLLYLSRLLSTLRFFETVVGGKGLKLNRERSIPILKLSGNYFDMLCLSSSFKLQDISRSPLAGIDLNLRSAQTLADTVDSMSIEISSVKKGVRLLNFGNKFNPCESLVYDS